MGAIASGRVKDSLHNRGQREGKALRVEHKLVVPEATLARGAEDEAAARARAGSRSTVRKAGRAIPTCIHCPAHTRRTGRTGRSAQIARAPIACP